MRRRTVAVAVLPLILVSAIAARAAHRPHSDPCRDMVRITVVTVPLCTHGPDENPRDLYGKDCLTVSPALDPLLADPLICDWPGLHHAEPQSDQAADCGVDNHRVRLVYLRSGKDPDTYAKDRLRLTTALNDADTFVNARARAEGAASAHIRVFTASPFDCTMQVANVVSDTGSGEFPDIIRALNLAGYDDDPGVEYMIYSPDYLYCGQATIRIDPGPDPTRNVNNNDPKYAVLGSSCLNGHTLLHELTHNLGGVQLAAPDATGNFHCNDGLDVMCYDDHTANSTQRRVCQAEEYDCGQDDYFSIHPAGPYLPDHWNIRDSYFVDIRG